jgi:nicotinamide mononucleotide adenylyltransferase
MKKVNICIGRFQPFTAGHYKCVEAAWKQKHLPTVICMIETAEAKVDKRHPFPSKLLIDLYNELFSNDNRIADVITVKNADIVANSKILAKNGYQIASWTCGTDRYPVYSSMAEKYHEQAGLSDDFQMIEVPRTDEDISATKARGCLIRNDKSGFLSLVPAMPKSKADYLFDTLYTQIKKVYVDEQHNRLLQYRVAKLERLLNINK